MFVHSIRSVACAHQSDPPPAAATTTSTPLTNDDGIHSLAKARCEREAQCHNLAGGDNKDRRDCTKDVYDEQIKVLGPDTCASGLDKHNLDKCIALLQDQLCEGKLGAIEAFPECHADRLCAK
jgi:hypothetical protein